MKNNIFKTLGLLFTMALALGSCSDENNISTDGEGKVYLNMSISDDVTVFGRSSSSLDTEDLADRCTTYVCSSEGLIRKYHGLSEVPSELWLVSGDYTIMAWTGDSVAASFEDKYYTAYTPFTISANATSTVTVECKIANVVASVNMDKSVDDVLTNYSVTIANAKGSLLFDSSNMDDAKGYFMMGDDETDLTWTINGEQYDGTPYEQTGTIMNAMSATEYALSISYTSNGEDVEYGGVMLDITVDQTEVEVNGSVVITSAPKIFGVSFDLDSPIYSPVGNFRDISVWVSAATSLANLEVSCDGFTSAGVSVNVMDFMKMTESAKTQIAAEGVSYEYSYDDQADASTAKITFAADLLNQFVEGEYDITIKAVDDFGKSKTGVVQIVISDAKVATNDVVRADVWSSKATITGNIADEEAQNLGFNYREKGASDWISVDAATVDDSSFSYILTGLTSGTTYEYAAKCDGYVDSNTKEFTTETEYVIPNAGFEYWSTASSGAIVPMASGDSFWDTGNEGSITMSTNVTTYDSSIKNSGSYSAKLSSQFVGIGSLIGAFAAGSIYAGEFGEVVGLGAQLFFGREFNESRPTKLVGYMKYTPGTVDYNSDYISTGDTDMGYIYVALSDSGSSYEVNTSTEVFFSKDSDGVFGYGELVQTTATSGDGMVRFEIPIEYSATDRFPNIIVLVATSSKYGDYFSGSTSSVMWIDDLELIYE